MSYNLLKDLPRSGFYGLDTLETLDLSFNDLRSVDSSLFDNMNWLVDLRVSIQNLHNPNIALKPVLILAQWQQYLPDQSLRLSGHDVFTILEFEK